MLVVVIWPSFDSRRVASLDQDKLAVPSPPIAPAPRLRIDWGGLIFLQERDVPILSRFFGILIFMHWRDHPPPHFHARYGDEEVTVEIATGAVTGSMNRRALSLVEEWRKIHREELLQAWSLAEQRRQLSRIAPLE